jgi:hypothetical protein
VSFCLRVARKVDSRYFGKIGFEPSSEIQIKFLEVQTDFAKDKAMCIENNHPQKSQNSEIHPWWE